MMVKITLSLLFFIISLVFSPVHADVIKINEFMANPPSGEGEWVEIYLPSGTSDISSYYLEDNNGTKKQLDEVVKCDNGN